MPKHDNNNQCTNQPLTAQAIGEKPEPKERKKRKNAKANGKAKGKDPGTGRAVRGPCQNKKSSKLEG